MTAPALDVRGLTVAYGDKDPVVADVDLEIAPGEMFGVVGASGSGKTTVLRAILQQLPENARIVEGSIRFRGQELVGLSTSKLQEIRGCGIGVIVQSPMAALNPVKRVGSQIAGLASEHGRKLTHEQLVGQMRSVGIQDPERVLHAYPHHLSGGMAQRVLIATALVLEPAVLLADEPTSALDVTIQAQIVRLLRALTEERGLAIVLVTHDIALVAEHCSRAVVMQRGKIVEFGTAAQVIHAPRHDYTIGLIESARPSRLRARESITE
jgi:ABC-type dipeptide/oligopeptide/nickel transport system ATPase component